MSNNVEEKILHGTTTVGIKATDGVVLCADMRASAGYFIANNNTCLLYTSPSPRDRQKSRMPSSA